MKKITEVPKDSKLRVIDFSADWCGHCRQLKPLLEAEETKNPDIEFCVVDVDTIPGEMLDTFNVNELPLIVAVKNGEVKSVYEESEGSLSSWLSFIQW